MSKKIRITPSTLETQAERLYNTGHQVDDCVLKAGKALRLIEEALSGKFTSNMDKKGAKLLKNMRGLRDTLYTGSKTAFQCASSFQNTDVVLRNLMKNSLPDDVKDTPPSTQAVCSEFEDKVEDMKQKEGFKQGEYWGMYSYDPSFGAYGCCAKAKQMQKEVTGKAGVWTGIRDASQIQPGDVIHYYYPGTYWFNGVEYRNEHWVFVTAVNGDTISVGEGNAWDGTNRERVKYRDMHISDFNNIESIYR